MGRFWILALLAALAACTTTPTTNGIRLHDKSCSGRPDPTQVYGASPPGRRNSKLGKISHRVDWRGTTRPDSQ
jgi:hypothetical protein